MLYHWDMSTGRRTKRAVGTKAPKTAKQMERHLKGIANHRRIDVLLLVNSRAYAATDMTR